jgi:hypothetical protein
MSLFSISQPPQIQLTTMPSQNEADMDPAVMLDSLNTLTHQLALWSEQPIIKLAQALTATQTELAGLKEQIVDLNKTVTAIRRVCIFWL